MPRTQIALTLAASLLAVAPLAALAQDASSDDKTFVKTAMEADMAEIQLSQIALQKSTNPDVKQFAQTMIDGHTKLDAQVKPVAQQLNIAPPTELNDKHKATKAKLEAESGAEFDKTYADAMLHSHEDADANFQKEASIGKDPQVKQVASRGEPAIAEHLQMAQKLKSSLK
jgi:putative membrane protein